MEATFADLDKLVALITSAVADLKDEHRRMQYPFPSLNDTQPHPLDSQHTPPKLNQAIQTIQGACAQLTTMVTPPSHTLARRALECLNSACTRVVIEVKIADILKDHPEGLHVSELAGKTGVHPQKLGRILRLLATNHCFREVRKDVYVNNRLSMLLTPEDEVGVYVHMAGDEMYKSGVYLCETLLDKNLSHSLEPDKTAFTRFYGKTLWDFWEEHPRNRQRFQVAMAGWAQVENMHSAERGYPWSAAPPGTVLCEVVGGLGHMSMHIARRHPNINVIVQDLESIVNQAIGYWNGFGAELVEQDRVDFLPLDPLVESPVEDCDYYYVKHVLHHWHDEGAVTILSNVRKVMKPSSRLILQEYIIQSTAGDACKEENDSLPRAPAPLLANYGEGKINRYLLDITMLTCLNSKERTFLEYKGLCERAGLKFVKMYDCGELSALEFKA
ncbi:S-adenosyl-L-methionine-dependent methyltransferase [Cristinia sonorae]|uniref:S-adenosyl-L-methionine-dependent methyltransferase n=1 Tax=Cristinia sonorae TaxID=1940300 RepID=A0A8K0XQN4_9AGAR|nr:S-adenosyl-L-methionine-dependent methyltransferase [Cristinia sonorae]